jgi:hypothetical protein
MQRTFRSQTEKSEFKIGKRRIKSEDITVRDLNPFNFECGFSSDSISSRQAGSTPSMSKLALFEAGEQEQVIVRERQGTLWLAGRELQVRSLHELKGLNWLSGEPLGYLFTQGDVEVAAISIKSRDEKAIYLPDTTDTTLRQALLQVLLALELLREGR